VRGGHWEREHGAEEGGGVVPEVGVALCGTGLGGGSVGLGSM
jgi:hypothetical protein